MIFGFGSFLGLSNSSIVLIQLISIGKCQTSFHVHIDGISLMRDDITAQGSFADPFRTVRLKTAPPNGHAFTGGLQPCHKSIPLTIHHNFRSRNVTFCDNDIPGPRTSSFLFLFYEEKKIEKKQKKKKRQKGILAVGIR